MCTFSVFLRIQLFEFTSNIELKFQKTRLFFHADNTMCTFQTGLRPYLRASWQYIRMIYNLNLCGTQKQSNNCDIKVIQKEPSQICHTVNNNE
jgi:hypothetical protein